MCRAWWECFQDHRHFLLFRVTWLDKVSLSSFPKGSSPLHSSAFGDHKTILLWLRGSCLPGSSHRKRKWWVKNSPLHLFKQEFMLGGQAEEWTQSSPSTPDPGQHRYSLSIKETKVLREVHSLSMVLGISWVHYSFNLTFLFFLHGPISLT